MLSFKNRFGLLPTDTEAFILASHLPKNIKTTFLVAQDTREDNWTADFISPKKIKRYHLRQLPYPFAKMDTKGCFKYSNLVKIIKKNKIDAIISTDNLAKIGQKNKIKIISNNCQLQKKFENKLWFDRFMTKYNLPKPPTIIYSQGTKKIFPGLNVLQKPRSEGGEGTYYVKNLGEIKKLIKDKKIRPEQKYLLRQFVAGRPCGLTLIITPKLIALSAIRLMCLGLKKETSQKLFLGVQWLATNSLNPRLKKNINQVFTNLGYILQKNKVYGHINLDFIIDKQDKIFIIECNPRFSASTIQLAQFSQTLSGLDAARIYFDLVFGYNEKQTVFYPLPESDFTGATTIIQFVPKNKNDKITITEEPANGLYQMTGNRIKFISPDLRRFGQNKKSNEFIFYTDTIKGETYKQTVDLGYITTSFPLFDSQTGQPNTKIEKITNYLKMF